MSSLFDAHRPRLERAIEACALRGAWSPFLESPSRKLHPEGAKSKGLRAFEACLNTPFPLTMPGQIGLLGEEFSPYTQKPLGIQYPKVALPQLLSAMSAALPRWRDASTKTRVGLCLEILDRLSAQTFTNTFATMHTTGQAFMMAFAGSGANSLDRGLEAIAYAYKAMRDVPESAIFERSFGAAAVRIEKRYRLIPRGIAAVITCGSYPAWNAYPAIFANLATGNPVVVKPHPRTILPMAIAVRKAREVLEEHGFDPNLVTLAADTTASPITVELVQHPDVAIIDFTGSQSFGLWLEEHCRHALVYTETSGCNAVIVDSTDDPQGMLKAIAQSVALFSSQMCTAAQNIFVPRSGVGMGGDRLSPRQFAAALAETMDAMLIEPTHAASLCGAIHSPDTLDGVGRAAQSGRVLRASGPYPHPEFPQARTATPLLLEVDASSEAYRREVFGPVAYLVEVDTREQAVEYATRDAAARGSIASYVYSTDPIFLDETRDAFALAGASLGCNLIGQLPINFTAAFSDYHVTGLNPAGNACLTDLAFVTHRFRIVQSKTEVRGSL